LITAAGQPIIKGGQNGRSVRELAGDQRQAKGRAKQQCKQFFHNNPLSYYIYYIEAPTEKQ
jgi:hypothetical protein